MYAIITLDLQVFGDLMMCILFYNDQQEHKEKYVHLILLLVLYGLVLLCILMYIFKCMVYTNAAPAVEGDRRCGNFCVLV